MEEKDVVMNETPEITTTAVDTEKLDELLEAKKVRELREILAEMQEVDVAEWIGGLDREQELTAFRTLPKDMASEVFAHFDADQQRRILESATDPELTALIENMFVDDAVDALGELPANFVRKILKGASSETRETINRFLKYKENTAGSVMTAEFVDLREAMTVPEAIERIRERGADSETIYTCYVIDPSRHLTGVVTVRELLLAKEGQTVGDLMDTGVISVTTGCDREEAVKILQKYALLSLPVTDEEKRLVGIITVDDAMDVMKEEATEDFEVMSAMLPSEKPYLKTGVFSLAKNRIVWLLVLMFSSMITGGILEKYELAFAAMPVLVSFIPMLTDAGGNAGSQASTLVIRGLATGDVRKRDIFRVLWKEIRVAVIVGAVMSLANFIRLWIMYPDNPKLGIVIALAMFATVMMAKTVGGILPIAAKAIKADPAIMAAPLITTIVDALSLVLYFTIATHLLNIGG